MLCLVDWAGRDQTTGLVVSEPAQDLRPVIAGESDQKQPQSEARLLLLLKRCCVHRPCRDVPGVQRCPMRHPQIEGIPRAGLCKRREESNPVI
jgi:hypothetical protein